ncbi:3'-5' exonuclease, partial [Vibrio fluvialis]|nr:3'-5' exonuclease [Vibrio fluvialis]
GDLVRFKQIENDGTFHRALADSQMTASLWMLMVNDLRERGVRDPSFALMQKISKTNKGALRGVLAEYMG